MAGASEGQGLVAGPKRPRLRKCRGGSTIPFSLDAPASVTVTTLDVTGRLVTTLASERAYPAGHHTLHWDGLDSAGRAMPSGVYFYRLETPAGAAARPMLLVK